MQTTNRTKDPRRQRKRLFNAPAHIRHKLMAAPLSPELIKSRSVRSLPVRKGDTVRVMRGDRKGFEGKISRIDLKNYRLYIEGLTREKVDGTTIFVPLHPSKVMIKNLNLDDKWRKDVVERKKQEAPKESVAKKQPTVPEKVKTELPSKVEVDKAKEPEKPAKKAEVATEVAKEKVPAKKSIGGTAVQKGKKTVKKEATTEAPAKKARAKRKSEKEGGA